MSLISAKALQAAFCSVGPEGAATPSKGFLLCPLQSLPSGPGEGRCSPQVVPSYSPEQTSLLGPSPLPF